MDKSRLWTIMGIGIVLRILLWQIVPVTGDASFHYTIIRFIGDELRMPVFEYVTGPNPYWYPPLFHISGAIVYLLTGMAELTPLLFGITGLFAFRKFVKVHYPDHADIATTILAFLPFHMYYSAIGYSDGLIFILAIGAYHFHLNFLKDGVNRDLFLSAAFSALAASTHYHGVVIALAIGGDLLVKKRIEAVKFFIIFLLLASPWYIRNTYVFGNPVWPKVYPGYFPGDFAVQSMPKTFDGMFGLHKWKALFFDFWIGAPNSGDDFFQKVKSFNGDIGLALSIIWLIPMAFTTLMGGMGLKRIENRYLLSLAFIISLIPFSGNGLARMFVAFIPFIVLAMATSYANWSNKYKSYVALVIIFAFICGTFGYGLTNHYYRLGQNGVWQAMAENIDMDENVIMPFTVADCTYNTGKRCIRIGSAGGIKIPTKENIDEILRDYPIDLVCCSNIAEDGFSATDSMICDHFKEMPPSFKHEDENSWVKCWQTS